MGDPHSTGQIIAIAFLIGLSCFFSMSETALTTVGKLKIRAMLDVNIKGADRLMKLKENQSKYLTAILIGNNFVNILATAIATVYAANFTGNNFTAIATGVMTFLILVFGEIAPKTFATHNADRIALAVAGPVYAIVVILTPVIYTLNFITFLLLRPFGVSSAKNEKLITEEDIKTILDVGHEEGVLEKDERRMIDNVVDFGDYEAKSVMTPRTKIAAAEVNSSYEDIMEVFKEERFSRLPIYEENIDNIIGILFAKDLIFSENGSSSNIRELLREAYFTYESKSSIELLAFMKNKRCSMMIVLDEYGGTSGIITMQDLIEEIVGEIVDEDDENADIEHINDGEYIVEGSTRIDEVNEMVGTSLESRSFDSIGGYVIEELGRFPEQGEEIVSNGIVFVIEETDKNRIEKIRLKTNAQGINPEEEIIAN